jgi:2-dehydropantoate 2-reductase
MSQDKWPRIAVVGAGAVGCYFGGMLARAGAPVTLIGRAQHAEAIQRDGLFLDSLHFQQRLAVSASTSVAAARDAAIVLLCVKTLDTEETARSLTPVLAAGAVVVSLQNGVDNVERIRTASGIDAIAAVVYVSAEMTAPGCVKHNGRGDLVLGDLAGGDPGDPHRWRQIANVAEVFTRAGVKCSTSDNIQAELWRKLIINCGYNAISALCRARYQRIVQNPWTREVITQVVDEAVAVGRAAGVRLTDVNFTDVVLQVGEAMANALSSTGQDIARGKRTEIDSLNGYVARRGAELGVATPVNQTLHALVKLLEEAA